MLADGRVVARSDEVVRRCRLRTRHPDAFIASCKFAPREHHSSDPCPYDLTFSQTTEELGRTTGNIPAARLTQPHTRLQWLLSSPLCGGGRIRRDRVAVGRLFAGNCVN
jgi:hypothetical protein